MWLFTKYGFFSIVCAAGKDKKPNRRKAMVRARTRAHLEALKRRFPKLLRGRIIETEKTDYGFRILIPKNKATALAAALMREIDYGNFKSAVAETHDGTGLDEDMKAYEKALHAVWAEMAKLQWGKFSPTRLDDLERAFANEEGWGAYGAALRKGA